MNSPLAGTWVSARSDIPEYRPGCEWLHFTDKGDHVWEIGQSVGKGRPSLNRVTLRENVGRYTLILLNGHGETVIAQIDCHGPEEIRVTPTHGHVTFFKRAYRPRQDRII